MVVQFAGTRLGVLSKTYPAQLAGHVRMRLEGLGVTVRVGPEGLNDSTKRSWSPLSPMLNEPLPRGLLKAVVSRLNADASKPVMGEADCAMVQV